MLKISEAPIQTEVVTKDNKLTPALARHLIELKNAIIELEDLVSDLNSRLEIIENAGYITDAPKDGLYYVRKDQQWVKMP